MGNPTARTHPVGAVVGCALLVAFSALAGVWAAGGYDVLRVGVLDNALANRLGYIGEISAATEDPLLRGISRSGMVVVLIVAVVGWPIAYAWTVLARRATGDQNAIELALGAALVGTAAGFVWLSADWTHLEPGDGNLFEQVIRYGNVWVPRILVGIATLLLLAWWTHPGEHQDETDQQNEHGHAATGP